MYPEVERFIAARESAMTAYDETTNGAHNTFYASSKHESDRDRYYEVEVAANHARTTAFTASWDTLIDETDDPLVGWIAKNCQAYSDYAVIILKALPASEAELLLIAENGSWCGVFGRFVGRAEAAGVLPGSAPLTPARQDMRTWFTRQISGDLASWRQLLTYVDAVIAESAAAGAVEDHGTLVVTFPDPAAV